MAEGLLLGGAGLPEGCLGLGRVLCWLYHLPPCLLMRRQFLNQFLCLFVCDSESQTGCLVLTWQHRGKMHLSGSGTAVLCWRNSFSLQSFCRKVSLPETGGGVGKAGHCIKAHARSWCSVFPLFIWFFFLLLPLIHSEVYFFSFFQDLSIEIGEKRLLWSSAVSGREKGRGKKDEHRYLVLLTKMEPLFHPGSFSVYS